METKEAEAWQCIRIADRCILRKRFRNARILLNRAEEIFPTRKAKDLLRFIELYTRPGSELPARSEVNRKPEPEPNPRPEPPHIEVPILEPISGLVQPSFVPPPHLPQGSTSARDLFFDDDERYLGYQHEGRVKLFLEYGVCFLPVEIVEEELARKYKCFSYLNVPREEVDLPVQQQSPPPSTDGAGLQSLRPPSN